MAKRKAPTKPVRGKPPPRLIPPEAASECDHDELYRQLDQRGGSVWDSRAIKALMRGEKSVLADNIDAIVDELPVCLTDDAKSELQSRLSLAERSYWPKPVALGWEGNVSPGDFIIAATRQSRSTRGQSADRRLHRLVRDLMRIYVEFTGRRAATSVNPHTGKPGGPLIRFVEICFLLLEIEKSPAAIRSLINRLRSSG